MTAHLTVRSDSDLVLVMVGDYARGLGCASEPAPAAKPGVRIVLPDADSRLLDLITYVALGCVKAGVDVAEPICDLTYQYAGAAAQVRLVLRIDSFTIDPTGAAG